MNEITVVIPAYNAERTVGRAVKSVLASTVPVDVVVVDDGSTDATAASAESAAAECVAGRGSSFRLLRQANAGAYTARVHGLEGVETPYFAFVDADDAVEPEMYAHLLAFAREHDLDIAQCDAVGAARAAGRGCSAPVVVGDGCWLCARATVFKGVCIPPRTVVAAGAVVVRSVSDRPGGMWAGVPAKAVARP